MKDSDIRILEVQPDYSDEKARTPLKFGAEGALYVHVRANVENRVGQVTEWW